MTGGAYERAASSSSFTFPRITLETGQPSLVASATCSKRAGSTPGTEARTLSFMVVMAKPSPCFSIVQAAWVQRKRKRRLSHDSTRLFETDGVRGHFGEPPLDRATVTALAVQLAATLRERRSEGKNGVPPRVVLGGDTRESTPVICRWLAAGLAAGGIDVEYAGVIPTPGVAWLARETGAAAGVVVSASHNPYPDNGIKLIDPQGQKWSDEDELALERRSESPSGGRAGAARGPACRRPRAARALSAPSRRDVAGGAAPGRPCG